MQIQSFTVKSQSPKGWGSGYIAVPLGHPLHGMSVDDVSHWTVHRGVCSAGVCSMLPDSVIQDNCVCSTHWFFMFHTQSWFDTHEIQNKAYVEEQTELMKMEAELETGIDLDGLAKAHIYGTSIGLT